jgi:hypothetical protein
LLGPQALHHEKRYLGQLLETSGIIDMVAAKEGQSNLGHE